MESSINFQPFVGFILYVVSGISYLVLATWVYIKFTPYDEIKLIKSGNNAAAISLAGAMIGMVLPIREAIEQSVSLGELFVWSFLGLSAQCLIYLFIRFIFKDISKQIIENQPSMAVFAAGVSVSTGLIVSAAMVYY